MTPRLALPSWAGVWLRPFGPITRAHRKANKTPAPGKSLPGTSPTRIGTPSHTPAGNLDTDRGGNPRRRLSGHFPQAWVPWMPLFLPWPFSPAVSASPGSSESCRQLFRPWLSSLIAAFRSRATGPGPFAPTARGNVQAPADPLFPLCPTVASPAPTGFPAVLCPWKVAGRVRGKWATHDAGHSDFPWCVPLRLRFRWHVYAYRDGLSISVTLLCH